MLETSSAKDLYRTVTGGKLRTHDVCHLLGLVYPSQVTLGNGCRRPASLGCADLEVQHTNVRSSVQQQH